MHGRFDPLLRLQPGGAHRQQNGLALLHAQPVLVRSWAS